MVLLFECTWARSSGLGSRGAPAGSFYLDRAAALVGAGVFLICIDVAHGHHSKLRDALTSLRTAVGEEIHIMAGNVATLGAFNDLADWGADSIRVGIGGGSICSTRIQTGHGMPTLQSVMDCAQSDRDATLIADGGIRTSGDIVKALAAGADFVMLGGMFAGHDEGMGKIVKLNGTKFIEFYGSSSDTAMNKHYGGISDYRSSEGKKVQLKYRGKIKDTVLNILGGLRSSCTYVGAPSLKQLSKCTTFVRVSNQFNDTFVK